MDDHWQVIDTAPRDGTYVILSDGRYTIRAAWRGDGWVAANGPQAMSGEWSLWCPDHEIAADRFQYQADTAW